jgi:hypothetical protein
MFSACPSRTLAIGLSLKENIGLKKYPSSCGWITYSFFG